jgi:RNase P/RNase MRP subunit POP5
MALLEKTKRPVYRYVLVELQAVQVEQSQPNHKNKTNNTIQPTYEQTVEDLTQTLLTLYGQLGFATIQPKIIHNTFKYPFCIIRTTTRGLDKLQASFAFSRVIKHSLRASGSIQSCKALPIIK